jgi:hypothetical protein
LLDSAWLLRLQRCVYCQRKARKTQQWVALRQCQGAPRRLT